MIYLRCSQETNAVSAGKVSRVEQGKFRQGKFRQVLGHIVTSRP